MISVPKQFTHKKGEIIFLVDNKVVPESKKSLIDFFCMIPDFPERSHQGDYEERIRL
jgi:hypothetical protein